MKSLRSLRLSRSARQRAVHSQGEFREPRRRADVTASTQLLCRIWGLLAAGMITLATGTPASAGTDPDPSCSRALIPPPLSGIVPGEYIVTFGPRVHAIDIRRFGVSVPQRVQSALKGRAINLAELSAAIEDKLKRRGRHVTSFRYVATGFSANLTKAERLLLDSIPGIEVVPDQYISLYQRRIAHVAAAPPNLTPLGLDRIDQRFGINGGFSARQTGKGVDIYVIDSGIRPFHVQFRTSNDETRVRYEIGQGGFNAVPGCLTTGDYLGHGTHVAGIIGGTTTGVAPDSILHSVRVFGEWSTTKASWVANAVDWVTKEHLKAPMRPAVANISLGARGGTIDIIADHPDALTRLNKFIDASINLGVTYVIAAGNDAGSACDVSPAMIPDAITVGAIDPVDDVRPDWSNQGKCVDIFAPGVQIWSADFSNDSTTPMDGTSMAAPHVAGVVALILQDHYPISRIELWNRIYAAATTSRQFPDWRICNIAGDSPSILLHWGAGSDDGILDDPSINAVLQPCDQTRLIGARHRKLN
jgi:hypothetical protein